MAARVRSKWLPIVGGACSDQSQDKMAARLGRDLYSNRGAKMAARCESSRIVLTEQSQNGCQHWEELPGVKQAGR